MDCEANVAGVSDSSLSLLEEVSQLLGGDGQGHLASSPFVTQPDPLRTILEYLFRCSMHSKRDPARTSRYCRMQAKSLPDRCFSTMTLLRQKERRLQTR